jgi:AcrR family transcriptional regulator
VFLAGGAEASLEAVARAAGVGIGTLYRHFPTREDLFEAVYRREVDQLVDLGATLLQLPDPVEALRLWINASVDFIAAKKGMAAAFALSFNTPSDWQRTAADRMTGAINALMVRAATAGAIRSDIGGEEVLRAVIGMCYMTDRPGWQPKVVRLVGIFIDGLRVTAQATHADKRDVARKPVAG